MSLSDTARAELEIRDQIQEAIHFANRMPEEIQCGVLVRVFKDGAIISVDPEVPYGRVHRFDYQEQNAPVD